ncbi:MAG TPA: response regulator [Candidatus Methylomirabilis sp.]|nr:response regulator [Candidatus Methylomirabilis sp.]
MGCRILVVEDDPDLRETLARLLGRSGYTCLTASSGSDGIRAIEVESPDLVVTDLHMPGTDGLAVMRCAREQVPPIPIVLMTAYPTPEAQPEVRPMILLAKPFANAQFLGAVRQALGNSRQ